MTIRFLPFAIVLLALSVVEGLAPAGAVEGAVTLRGLAIDRDDNPRSAWFERYQESRQGPEQIEKFSRSVKVDDSAVLDLSHLSGDVRVTGGSGSEIRIEATKRVRHRNPEEAKRLLEELRIEVNSLPGRVEVRTVYPRRTNSRGNTMSGSVDYVIAVPSGAAVAVKSISGDLSISNVRGEVRAEAISGNVNITNTPNVSLAKTVSGDVVARDIGTQTALVLGTVSGNVVGTGLKVRTLEAGTVSGDVRLAGSQIERLEVKALSGNIQFDAPLVKGGRYEFTSHSGDVRLILSGNTGFELDADTFSGSVRSDIPVTLRTVGQTRSGERRSSPRAIRGTYGDASAILSVRSHSGSVVITKK
jgi:DUF4097 and DUF4098 domain-containing protein YvlB